MSRFVTVFASVWRAGRGLFDPQALLERIVVHTLMTPACNIDARRKNRGARNSGMGTVMTPSPDPRQIQD
jgi:hypothetical protein